MTLRDDLAGLIDKKLDGDCGYGVGAFLADAILASDLICKIRAEAWNEGALWAAVECDAIPNKTVQWLAPGDNPYREGQA